MPRSIDSRSLVPSLRCVITYPLAWQFGARATLGTIGVPGVACPPGVPKGMGFFVSGPVAALDPVGDGLGVALGAGDGGPAGFGVR